MQPLENSFDVKTFRNQPPKHFVLQYSLKVMIKKKLRLLGSYEFDRFVVSIFYNLVSFPFQ